MNELSVTKNQLPKEAGGNIFLLIWWSGSTPSIVKEDAGPNEVPLDDLNEVNLGEATSGMMGSTRHGIYLSKQMKFLRIRVQTFH